MCIYIYSYTYLNIYIYIYTCIISMHINLHTYTYSRYIHVVGGPMIQFSVIYLFRRNTSVDNGYCDGQ